MARAGGHQGGGMGGGPDSSPDGSSAAGPGGTSNGNAPDQGMGADAFDANEGASKDFGNTVEGFRAALAKAMGATIENNVDREAFDAEMEDAANNRAIAAAVEARDKAARETKEQQERQAMMDKIDAMQNKTNFADPTKAPSQNINDVNPNDLGVNQGNIGVDVDDRGLLGPSVDDDRSLEMSQEKDQERDVNKNVDIGIGPESFTDPSKPSSHPSRDTRIGMPFGVGRPAPTDQQENREPVDMYGRVTEFENIDDPERKAAAYEALAQLQKQAMEAQTPLGKALRSIFGMMEYGTVGTIGKAMKAALDKLGFNVDPNIIGQAMAIAHESVTQGPMGPGGVSIGSRNDNFLNEFLRALPAEEPWMKGLSQSQIDYYLNDPDELDWVRNLYKNMNP